MRRLFIQTAALLSAAFFMPTAHAGTIDLLYETDADMGAGSEFFVRTFGSTNDLISGNLGSGSFSQLDLGSDFSIAGMTYDATGLHLLYEADTDAGAGSEFFLRSFASRNDLVSGTLGSGSFSQLDLGSEFSVGGFTYDGSLYHLIYETDTDAGAGSEFFVRSFASLADLVSGNLGSGSFSQLDLGSDFSVAGFNWNDMTNMYDLLYETETDAGAGSEFFHRSFLSVSDLISGNIGSGSFSQLDLGSDFSVAGYASTQSVAPTVPAPATLGFLGLGLLGLGWAHRRRARA